MSQLYRLVLIAVLLVAFTRPTYAYLDPTSGSMFLQMILGGIAGMVVVFKLYWQRILSFFSGGRQRNDEPPA